VVVGTFRHPLPPFLVSVAVFNAAGTSGVASKQADKLQVRGYFIATVDNAPSLQVGKTVACRDGYEKERNRLAKRIDGATAVVFPTGDYFSVEAFPAVAYAHCVVIVGS
jgi:hypothetical protein